MPCDKCGSDRIVSVQSKARDLHFVDYPKLGFEHDGYLPDNLGVGGGDYVEFSYCLECGKIQGNFPISDETVRSTFNEDDEDDCWRSETKAPTFNIKFMFPPYFEVDVNSAGEFFQMAVVDKFRTSYAPEHWEFKRWVLTRHPSGSIILVAAYANEDNDLAFALVASIPEDFLPYDYIEWSDIEAHSRTMT